MYDYNLFARVDSTLELMDIYNARDVVEEGGQRCDGVVSQMLELDHHLLLQLVVQHRHRQRTGFVCEKVSEVGALKMKL